MWNLLITFLVFVATPSTVLTCTTTAECWEGSGNVPGEKKNDLPVVACSDVGGVGALCFCAYPEYECHGDWWAGINGSWDHFEVPCSQGVKCIARESLTQKWWFWVLVAIGACCCIWFTVCMFAGNAIFECCYDDVYGLVKAAEDELEELEEEVEEEIEKLEGKSKK
mmetsp:Transcript_157604/g.302547  ORF Transcript_157604/g.302547 Transcript_157604/m.302547 type:complete len:167 (-) Transcript_157604:109-609(-)